MKSLKELLEKIYALSAEPDINRSSLNQLNELTHHLIWAILPNRASFWLMYIYSF
jgi:hypothetical protein